MPVRDISSAARLARKIRAIADEASSCGMKLHAMQLGAIAMQIELEIKTTLITSITENTDV